jgi:hypothetical protein
MPVTFTVADHPANPVAQGRDGSHTARQFLALACKEQSKKAGEILRTSLTDACGEPNRNMHAFLAYHILDN